MSSSRFGLFLRAFVPACLCAFSLTACSSDPTQGYSFRPARLAGIKTISVPVFDNASYMHGLEYDLSEAIVKEVQRNTQWVVVQGGQAQTSLTGSIQSAALQPLSVSSKTGMVMEQGVELSVNFVWRDARTGEVLIARNGFKTMQSFVPARGTDETLALGQHAAVQELARSIVNELRSSW